MFGLSKLENKKNGYGTQTVRFGRDAQIRFGWCALSLQAARHPVCTPHGVVYDRETILHYLLERKVQLRAAKVEYDAQLARQEAKQARSAEGEQAQRANALRQKMAGGLRDGNDRPGVAAAASSPVGSNSSRSSSSTGSGPASASAAELKTFSEEELKNRILTHGRDTETLEDKRARLAQTNFWMSEVCNPDAGPKQLTAPDTCPRCPITGKFLRSKQLYTVKFTRDNTVTFGEPGNIVCCVSQKAITHQQATLLRGCGCVLLSEHVKELVLPTMRCPACNTKVKKKAKDVVSLKTGGTSFSSHSKVESSKYRPNVR